MRCACIGRSALAWRMSNIEGGVESEDGCGRQWVRNDRSVHLAPAGERGYFRTPMYICFLYIRLERVISVHTCMTPSFSIPNGLFGMKGFSIPDLYQIVSRALFFGRHV